jgi:ribosomal protein S6
MKTYESVTILKPQLTDNEVAAFVEKTKAFITEFTRFARAQSERKKGSSTTTKKFAT